MFETVLRGGRKKDEQFVWIEPRAVRWRVSPCPRRDNWKSIRWRVARAKRSNWKFVRWRVKYQNEPNEADCGVEGAVLIEDDQQFQNGRTVMVATATHA